MCRVANKKYALITSSNRFTVLKIKDINTSDSEPKDIYLSAPVSYLIFQRPKWEKQLPKELSTNILDICRTSLVLTIELSTTSTSELHSINVLLDCRTTRSFIDCDFVYSKGINTQTISCPILVYNIDSSPNKVGQISEVVNIVLCYYTYSEWMLLAISSLGKQKLILGYTWLKDHSPKVDWQKGEVCIIQCLSCHDTAKWLSYYLYFFSFSFHLIRKLMDIQEGMTQKRCMGLYK